MLFTTYVWFNLKEYEKKIPLTKNNYLQIVLTKS